MSADRDVVLLA
jgi:hypothetical protein